MRSAFHSIKREERWNMWCCRLLLQLTVVFVVVNSSDACLIKSKRLTKADSHVHTVTITSSSSSSSFLLLVLFLLLLLALSRCFCDWWQLQCLIFRTNRRLVVTWLQIRTAPANLESGGEGKCKRIDGRLFFVVLKRSLSNSSQAPITTKLTYVDSRLSW